jgi:hypothetical protein
VYYFPCLCCFDSDTLISCFLRLTVERKGQKQIVLFSAEDLLFLLVPAFPDGVEIFVSPLFYRKFAEYLKVGGEQGGGFITMVATSEKASEKKQANRTYSLLHKPHWEITLKSHLTHKPPKSKSGAENPREARICGVISRYQLKCLH